MGPVGEVTASQRSHSAEEKLTVYSMLKVSPHWHWKGAKCLCIEYDRQTGQSCINFEVDMKMRDRTSTRS